ncbi:MAG: DUF1934 domain-containing protein [Oscillospiraceae bacterium]|nr:DUF1934 domain-containing protein [Oscillospiraceae bacterium]
MNINYKIKALFITSENEKTKISTSCNYFFKPDLSIISYLENLENLETKIYIYNNKKIIISRQSNNIIIEKNIRNECKYKTPFGVILMGTTGEFLDINLSKDSGEINFKYKIDFNNLYSHSNQAKIKIIKNKIL